MDLLEQVKKNIQIHGMFEAGDRILIGLSGGADSMTLMHSLKVLGEEFGWSIFAAHLNHCFRGDEADADQRFVVEQCEKFGVPLLERKMDVRKVAEEEGLSSEEAGRNVRYALFREAVETFGCHKIAVAQNKKDQCETLLLNLMRGTGVEGLKGMEFISGNIHRPLLNVSREEIEEYCEMQAVPFVVDGTNLQPVYSRNRVRLELLPYMKENFNPGIEDALYRLTETANEENAVLLELARNTLATLRCATDKRGKETSSEQLRLRANELLKLLPGLKKRVIREALREVTGNLKGIERKHIEGILTTAGGATGSAMQLPGGVRIEKSYEWLIFKREQLGGNIKMVEKNHEKWYHILVYGNNVLNNRTRIIIERLIDVPVLDLKKELDVVYIDEKKLKSQLVARFRREGDRFTPIGMKGSKKLKEYFIDEKIPKAERDERLLICDDAEIVWITGDRISENYRIEPTTKQILKIKVIQGD